MDAKQTIETGRAILGIEFGSTRIKAVLIDEANRLIRKGKDRTAVDVAATCRAWSDGARANYLDAERLAKQGR